MIQVHQNPSLYSAGYRKSDHATSQSNKQRVGNKIGLSGRLLLRMVTAGLDLMRVPQKAIPLFIGIHLRMEEASVEVNNIHIKDIPVVG